MKKNNIVKLISQPKSSAGFTLIELLVASIIGVIIIGAAGFGLTQVLKASKDGNAAAERRAEVARAYDFISDEIRRAELIEDDATNATGYTTDPDEDVVLALKIPDVDNDADNSTEARILYYVADAEANSVWKGPKVLYRWGPPLGNDGNYTNGTWDADPLLDEIDDTNITLSCETNWTSSIAAGFGACIDPNRKAAQLYIDGDIKKALGQNDTYKSNTKTFARSNQATGINLSEVNDYQSQIGGQFNGNGTGNTPIDTEFIIYHKDDDPDTQNVDERTQAQFQETVGVGGSMKKTIIADQRIRVTSSPPFDACGSASSCSPVSVDIKVNSSTNQAEKIAYYDTDNDDHKVIIYYNTAKVPNDPSKVYPGQKTPYQFLKDVGVTFLETDADLPEYTIKMNPNQMLLAFEIGQTDSTIPDGNGGTKPNPGYDHQDNLVILTSNDLNYPDP